MLVRLGCEATVQDNVASTPLHVAAGEGHLDAIAALVNLVSLGSNLFPDGSEARENLDISRTVQGCGGGWGCLYISL